MFQTNKKSQMIQARYSTSEPFCFCLLQVQQTAKEDEKMKTDDGAAAAGDSLVKDLPINLYELHQADTRNSILLGLSNWELTTSTSERIAVERVMKERPTEIGDDITHNPFVMETKQVETSLKSMKDRVQVLVTFLEDMQAEKIPYDPVAMRRIQGLVTSLGSLAEKANSGGGDEDVRMMAHLALVARTINSMQCYSDKFRTMHENRGMAKEMRRPF